jgi:hypothetical protein
MVVFLPSWFLLAVTLCFCPVSVQCVQSGSYVAVKTVTGIQGMVYDHTSSSLLLAVTSAVKRLTLSSNVLTTVAGDATTPGYVSSASFTATLFESLRALAWIGSQQLVASDALNYRLRLLDFSTSQVTRYAGTSTSAVNDDSNKLVGTFGEPQGIAWASGARVLYVIDYDGTIADYYIRKVSTGITTVAGGGSSTITSSYITGTSLRLSGLTSLVVSPFDSRVYFTNNANNDDYVGVYSPSSLKAKVSAGTKSGSSVDNVNPLSGAVDDPQALYICTPSVTLIETYDLLRELSHVRGLRTVSPTHTTAKVTGQQIAVSPDGVVYTYASNDMVYRVSGIVCAATDTTTLSPSVKPTRTKTSPKTGSLSASTTSPKTRSLTVSQSVSHSRSLTISPSQTAESTESLPSTESRSDIGTQ